MNIQNLNAKLSDFNLWIEISSVTEREKEKLVEISNLIASGEISEAWLCAEELAPATRSIIPTEIESIF